MQQTEAPEVRFMESKEELQALLSGKRVLHVKGFGSGFVDAISAEAVQAIAQFRSDFLVIDGDPFGSGFQRYIKAYVDRQGEAGLAVPELVWVNVKESCMYPRVYKVVADHDDLLTH